MLHDTGLRPSTETRRLSDSSGFVLSDGCEPSETSFELDRGFAAERGMQSASVIDVFDEGAYVGSGLLDRGVGAAYPHVPRWPALRAPSGKTGEARRSHDVSHSTISRLAAQRPPLPRPGMRC